MQDFRFYRGVSKVSTEIQLVKFPKSQMKPLCAQWLREMYTVLAHPDITSNGFNAAGITEMLK